MSRPTLNLDHGFVKAIRRRLQHSAEEFGIAPVDDASHCSTNGDHASRSSNAADQILRRRPTTSGDHKSCLLGWAIGYILMIVFF